MNPALSIVIAVKDCFSETKSFLDSLRQYSPSINYEVILVDDCSGEETQSFLNQYGETHGFCLVRNPVNKGFAFSCNRGAASAKGRWLMFLNNDLLLTKNWFEPFLKVINGRTRLKKPGLIGNIQIDPRTDKIDHAGVQFVTPYPSHYLEGSDQFPRKNFSRFLAVTAACVMIRRDLFLKVGGFDESYRTGYEDTDLCLRLRMLGFCHYVANKSRVYHKRESSPGRHTYSAQNTRLFMGRWGRVMSRLDDWDRSFLSISRPILDELKETTSNYTGLIQERGERFLFADKILLQSVGYDHLSRQCHDFASQVADLMVSCFPSESTTWEFRGKLARSMGGLEDARRYFRLAIKADPSLEAHVNGHLAEVELEDEKPTQALQLLEKSITQRPEIPRFYFLMGISQKAIGNETEALGFLNRCVILDPGHRKAWKQIGLQLRKLSRPSEALMALQRYLRYKPADIDVVRIVATQMESMQIFNGAVSIYRTAYAAKAILADRDAFLIGRILYGAGRFEEAELWLKKCVHLNSYAWEAFHYLGNIGVAQKDYPKAVKYYKVSLPIQPDQPSTLNNLANSHAFLCDWSNRKKEIKQLNELYRKRKLTPGTFEVLGLSMTEQDHAKLAEIQSDAVLSRTTSLRQKLCFNFKVRKDGLPRIGFLSQDIRNHAVGHHIEGLISNQDKTRFETYIYATTPDDGSEVRKQISVGCVHFRDISRLNLSQKAQVIYGDDLDLLVDLGGHSMGSNVEVLALRPARRQADFLGYAASMGPGLVDFHIVDEIVIPESSKSFYAEEIVYMGGPFFPPGDFKGFASRVKRKDVGLPVRGFVYCAFHAAYKLDPEVFGSWMRILKAVPESVLWLKFKPGEDAIKNLRSEAIRRGVSSKRIIMAEDLPGRPEHLSRMTVADLYLDCPLYNGHASAMDALHAKLPILTIKGSRFCNRVGESLVQHLGLPQMVAKNLKEYEKKAIELGRRPSKLLVLRKTIQENAEKVLSPRLHAQRFDAAIDQILKKPLPKRKSKSPVLVGKPQNLPLAKSLQEMTLVLIRQPGVTNWADNVNRLGLALGERGGKVIVLEGEDSAFRKSDLDATITSLKIGSRELSSVFNYGLINVKNRYALILDDPLRVMPAKHLIQCAEEAIKAFESNKIGYLGIGSSMEPHTGCLVSQSSNLNEQTKPVAGLFAPCFAINMEALVQAGGFRSLGNSIALSSLDLSLRMEASGYKSSLLECEGILCPVHAGKDYLNSAGKQNLERFEKVWKRNPVSLKPKYPPKNQQIGETSDYQEWVRLCDTLTETDLARFRDEAAKLERKPLISVIMPVFNPPRKFLKKAIESVLSQTYENWELCIADDASTKKFVRPLIKRYARQDSRIKTVFRKKNGHISLASNSALKLAKGEYVAFFDHDDELRPHSLLEVARVINENPEAKLIYSDEDKIDEEGERYDPYFKPDWNPDLFLGQNYISHFSVIKHDLVKSLGGLRKGFEGAQDWDLLLRVIERIDESDISHIPKVLYHWRAIKGSTASGIGQKVYALKSIQKTIRGHLNRTETKASLSVVLNQFIRVQRELPLQRPLVSILIPTRDRLDLLSKCLESLRKTISYEKLEILILDNDSSEPETLAYFRKIRSEFGVKVLKVSGEFNYSQINNVGARHVKGELLLLLNNDIEAVREGWFEEMISHAVRPEIGCVGAKLLYPDGTIQHAGVVLGIRGVAGHAFLGFPGGADGYMGYLQVTRNFSAVTGACLMIRKKTYLEVGGLDEGNFGISFNDVDFCLRVSSTGCRNLWTPHALLYHHESASRGGDQDSLNIKRAQREQFCMLRRWFQLLTCDPGYNPNFSYQSEQFQLSVPEHTLVPDEPTTSPESPHSFSHTAVGNAYRRLYNQLRVDHGEDQALELVVGGGFEEFGLQEIEILRYFGLKEKDFLVDVGCGSGRLAIPLSNTHKGGYLGTDVVPEALEYARERVRRKDWRFELVEDLTIPLPDQTADMVCFLSVFTHLLHEQTFLYLKEALRVLKPGGRIVFSFLDFEEQAHWPNFESSIHSLSRGNPLNVFMDRNAIRAWTEILGIECRAILSASRKDGGDFPVSSFGQSLACLAKVNPSQQHESKSVPDSLTCEIPALKVDHADSINSVQNRKYKQTWNKLSHDYESAKLHVTGDATESELRASAKETIDRINQSIGITKSDVVLEIGCGIGRIGRELASKCRKWIGCDISPNMLKYASRRLSHLKNIELVELPESNLSPIPDSSVDAVYCSVVFMHLDEWDRFEYVREAFRVLRPGGRVYLDNFNLLTDEGWDFFMTHHSIPSGERPAHISKSSTPQELEVYLRRSRFEEIKIQEDDLWVCASGVKDRNSEKNLPAFLKKRNEVYLKLKGEGLEIGAFEHPASLNESCNVTYFDRLDKTEACELFPEIDFLALPEVDVVGELDKEGLSQFQDESFDFVIINHVLEHLYDPISAIGECVRVLRTGGSLVLAVPDKRFTFDKKRPLTSAKTLLERHKSSQSEPMLCDYEDVIHFSPHLELRNARGKKKEKLLFQMKERREHLNVWTSKGFRKLLHHSFKLLKVKVLIEKEIFGDESKFEYVAKCKKVIS